MTPQSTGYNPSDMQPLDPLSTPLTGVNIIEAGAGTGKTYTLAILFLRLLLEKGLPVNRILVVTYTVAATAELRDRIRRRIREALDAFESGASDDEALLYLLSECSDRETAIGRLGEALAGFDEAAIYTIHGFCQRVLRDNAFESSALFDTELTVDQSDLIRQIVDDYWRAGVYPSSRLFAQYLASQNVNPDNLFKLVRNGGLRPGQQLLPDVMKMDREEIESTYSASVIRLQTIWEQNRPEVEDILLNSPALNRQKYKPNSIPGWCDAMDGWLNHEIPSPVLFDKFTKFTADFISRAVKKNHEPPVHEFFSECGSVLERAQAFACLLVQFKVELFEFVQNEMARRKRLMNIQGFDDLLTDLNRALDKQGGKRLARMIREKYQAALIDEFQDTDSVQYEIFGKIYFPVDSILFLIGDPKQAIYGFRGADIFAYMKALTRADARYTLLNNYRSEPLLLIALNTLFSPSHLRPFIFENIRYHRLSSGHKANGGPESLTINGKTKPPFVIWFQGRENARLYRDCITKPWARERVSAAVASEVVRLLSPGRAGEAVIGERPVEPGDIALLVRSHNQAAILQQALTACSVPSALHSQENLFFSQETEEIERALLSIVRPDDESLVRGALLTHLFGFSANRLHAVIENDREWESRLERIREYHTVWQAKGFMRMFCFLMAREGVHERLLAFPDGERRLTNILHAAELLQQAEIEHKLGMAGLVKWLQETRQLDGRGADEQQLRLESDEKRVKIVTIHCSKGLEYPIVFCPFAWDGYIHSGGRGRGPVTFHDHQNDDRLTLDLGSDDWENHSESAKMEEQAENLRLLYVALTRAVHRCYVVAGPFTDYGTSALAYLLHHGPDVSPDDALFKVKDRVKGLSDKEIFEDLRELEARAKGAVSVCDMPGPSGERLRTSFEQSDLLKTRAFDFVIRRDRRISSYSSLISAGSHDVDRPDRDQMMTLPSPEPSHIVTERNIFTFPKGAAAGTLIHKIFEEIDFQDVNSEAAAELISRVFRRFGFDPEWAPVIQKMIAEVLDTPLGFDAGDLKLADIALESRLDELEFYYPVSRLTPEGLSNVFRAHGLSEFKGIVNESMDRLRFSPVRGFLKGYMDLVFEHKGRFFLVDYKSNHLGFARSEYSRERLTRVMADDQYMLQYHLYTVALHMYLAARIPEYSYDVHFGGVYYLFVRGMGPPVKGPGPNEPYGVFFDRPDKRLIEALCACIIQGRII